MFFGIRVVLPVRNTAGTKRVMKAIICVTVNARNVEPEAADTSELAAPRTNPAAVSDSGGILAPSPGSPLSPFCPLDPDTKP